MEGGFTIFYPQICSFWKECTLIYIFFSFPTRPFNADRGTPLSNRECIVSIVRIVYAHTFGRPDATWSNVPTANLITVELSIGILCSCVPAYRPLLIFLFPSTRSNLGGKVSKSDGITSSSGGRSGGSSGWRRGGGQGAAAGKIWGDSVLETGVEDDGYAENVQLARPTNRARAEGEAYEMR